MEKLGRDVAMKNSYVLMNIVFGKRSTAQCTLVIFIVFSDNTNRTFPSKRHRGTFYRVTYIISHKPSRTKHRIPIRPRPFLSALS